MMEDLWECNKCGWIGTEKEMETVYTDGTTPLIELERIQCPNKLNENSCAGTDFSSTGYSEITISR